RTYIQTKVARRSVGLTVKTNALYWLLVRLARPVERLSTHLAIAPSVGSVPKKIKATYLVRALRFDPETVASALDTLERIGLIRRVKLRGGYFAVGIPPLTDEQRSWWRDRENSESVGLKELFGLPSPLAAAPGKVESIRVRALSNHG